MDLASLHRLLSLWTVLLLVAGSVLSSGCSSGDEDASAASPRPDTSALAWSSSSRASAPLANRSKWPSLAIDPDDTVRIAVTTTPDTSHTPDEVVLLRRRGDGSWALDAEVSQTPTVSRHAVAHASGDSTHVFWVEHDAPGADVPLGSSVWHRACTRHGCTPSDSLYRIAPGRANDGRVMLPSPPISSTDGRLTTALHVIDGGRSGTYVYRRSGRGWSSRRRFVNAAEPVLLAGNQGTRHLVYVADLNRGETPDPNSIVVRTDSCAESDTSTEAPSSSRTPWCPPRLIHASNGEQAYAPSAVLSPDRLHVAWLVDAGETTETGADAAGSNAGAVQCIRHRSVSRADSSSSTSEAPGSTDAAARLCPPAPGRMYDVNTAVDAAGRLHLIATWQPDFAAPKGHLYHALWDDGVWSTMRRIPGIQHSAIEADVQHRNDRLHLAWTRIRGDTVEVRYASAPTAP